MKDPKYAWLFDVDGVITDPQAKQIVHPEIIGLITKKLLKEEPVGLITGRSVDWLEERILHHFEKEAQNHLSHFFISAETGGVYGSYKNNKLSISVDEKLKVPDAARKEIKDIANKYFPKIMFYDLPKKTMATIEVIDGVPIEEFKKLQPKLDKLIFKVFQKYNLKKKFKMDSVRLSTDVESIYAGKDLAAKRFLDWLNNKNIKPEKFYSFGDSNSDVAMAEELYKNKLNVTFVFVGEPNLLIGKFPFKIVYPKSLFDKGVVEFLSK